MVIEFEFETEYGTFRDALHFSDDAVPNVDEIERLKLERRDNWLAAIESASASDTPFTPVGE
jgi:hypothetical protein